MYVFFGGVKPLLVGGIPTPLKNMSQLGWLFPIWWEKLKKIMFQTTNQLCSYSISTPWLKKPPMCGYPPPHVPRLHHSAPGGRRRRHRNCARLGIASPQSLAPEMTKCGKHVKKMGETIRNHKKSRLYIVLYQTSISELITIKNFKRWWWRMNTGC